MREEVKAAAERLRQRLAFSGYVMDNHSPEFDKHVEDLRSIAKAYLAEHQSDDSEAITEMWLSKTFGDEESANIIISIDGVGWLLLDFASGEQVRVKDSQFQTRGQLRQLLKALGVNNER